jgi:hypothetical protein
MRSWLLLVVIGACTSSSSGSKNGPAFEVTSTDLTLAPGEETTKCFYFHTSNTTVVAINKWVSDLTPGSHHMIFYQTLGGTPPPDGTIDDCGGGGGGTGGTNIPLPVYLTQIAHQEADFPTDDGTGFPLAQEIQPNTAGFLQMHYLNTTDQPLTAHVSLQAYALAEAKGFTHTDPFVTYNADISIAPHAVGQTVTATCPSPTQTSQLTQFKSYQFWSMSTHSHKQTVMDDVKDGQTMVLQTTDWEHPTVQRWDAPTFYTFTGGVTWECTYTNDGANANNTIVSGSSAATNEMCMAAGYYFPSAGPRGCFMSNGSCDCFL